MNTRVPELKPIYDARDHKDFRELLNYAEFQFMTDDAFILKTGKDENGDPIYRHITFQDFKNEVCWFGQGMLDLGLKGTRVAIIGKNSYEWYMSYYSVLCGLGIAVPLDKGLPYEETETSLIKSKADVFIFDKDHSGMAKQLEENGKTQVKQFISMDGLTPGYRSVEEIMKKGCASMKSGNDEFLTLPIDGDKMAVILFTSGTTSKAKAVMLSERNILSNVYMLDQVEDLKHGDVTMAFLPFHHTFGSTGQTMIISRGATTVFCDGLKYIGKNIKEYHISYYICVPLLIEAVWKRIQQGIDKKGMRKKYERGVKIARFLRKFHIDVRRKIFKDVLKELGGEMRFVVSGASALDPEVAKGYEDIGITVVQGYGMTEASPVIAGENSKTKSYGSIGYAMPGVDLVVADQNEEGIGELVCKGPNVMLGYYEDQEATDEVLVNGWLHTGDLASLDQDGFIFIRGRKKNVIVLKNGKNVYPEEIEALVGELPYVKECMVYGEKRRRDGDKKDLTLAVKIVYDEDIMERDYGVKVSPEPKDAADGEAENKAVSRAEVSRDVIDSIVKRDIDAINEKLPTYKQIRRFDITTEEMEKTTTGKIKRYAQN